MAVGECTVRTRRKKAKVAFLEYLRDGYSVTGAAVKAGVARRTVYDWRDEDEEFAQAWADAWESRGDWYEDRNRDAAATGQMAAILNGLRIHRRIVDRHEVTGQDGKPLGVVVLPDVPEIEKGEGSR